jgi:putative DNA primase/helicase
MTIVSGPDANNKNNVDNSKRILPGIAQKARRKVFSSEPPAPRKTATTPIGRPTLKPDDPELSIPEHAGMAWNALQAHNNPPILFRRGGASVRFEVDEGGTAILRELTAARLKYELLRAANWVYENKQGLEYPSAPNGPLIADMLARPNPPFPTLRRIVPVPVFSAAGTLQVEPGYHRDSQTIYRPPAGFVLPKVPMNPTEDDLTFARDVIVTDLLGDFPFANASSKAYAVALTLLPFVRDLIAGATPLHIINKPIRGAGATLLVEVSLGISLGHAPAMMTMPASEDEVRRTLTARLISLPAVVVLDNVRELDSPGLCAAITESVHTDRIVGSSEARDVPVTCAWVATGNNPTLGEEVVRRIVDIRLDPKTDHPELRTDFRHPDLRRWASDNRPELVHAALTIVQAWIAAGRPQAPGLKRLGMFEGYSDVMGGILHVAGIDGFMSDLEERYSRHDSEGSAWQSFAEAWWSKFKGKQVGVKELRLVYDTIEGLPDLGEGGNKSQATRLGKIMRAHRDRQFGRLQITVGDRRQGAQLWTLVEAEKND